MALREREGLAAHYSRPGILGEAFRSHSRPSPFQTEHDTGTATRQLGYGTIEFTPHGTIRMGLLDHTRSATTTVNGGIEKVPEVFSELAAKIGVDKIVGSGIIIDTTADPDAEYAQRTDAQRVLWKQSDIYPTVFSRTELEAEKRNQEDQALSQNSLIFASEKVRNHYTDRGTELIIPNPETGRVHATELASLEDWQEEYPQNFWQESMNSIDQSAEALKNTIVIRINTTAKAGGVAGMNHPLDAFVKAYNAKEWMKMRKGERGNQIDFRWYVANDYIDPGIARDCGIDLSDSAFDKFRNDDGTINIFKLTKLRHNIIQGVAPEGEDIGEKENKLQEAWGKSQMKHRLKEVRKLLRESKDNPAAPKIVTILDDQQVDVLAQLLQEENPDAILAYRSHIQFKSDPRARRVIDTLMERLVGRAPGNKRRIKTFISHRSRDEEIDDFLPKGADGKVDPRIADITAYKVATADQVGDLERKFADPEMARPYLEDINDYLRITGQKPIDADDIRVGFVGQFARLDPSKNHEGAINAAVLRIEKMLDVGVPFEQIPGQIIAGYAARDDTDGDWVEKDMRNLIKQKSEEYKDKIPNLADKLKLFRFRYEEFDGRHMNVLQRLCILGEQLSHAEGCEDKITQLLQMHIPVLVADVGGMPPQIVPGKNGIKISNPRNVEEIADIQFRLLMEQYLKRQNPDAYPAPTELEKMSENARKLLNLDYTTLANVRDIFGIAALLRHQADSIPGMVKAYVVTNGQQPFIKDLVLAA